jgi:hypothetical protein
MGQWFVGGWEEEIAERAGRAKDQEPERGSSETVREKVVEGRGVGEVMMAR